ncbi:2-keto-4-pentenoate hydratase, partial [Actinomadura adrarensis]
MAGPLTGIDVERLAQMLDRAWENRTTVPPLSESEGLDSTAIAYEIQTRWNELRLARGDRVIGHKIGLTSRAMQEQMGVAEPDYGRLWESRLFPAADGRATIPTGLFLQPRIEGELAFLMGAPLSGPEITAADVLAATEAVAVAVEVIDSRFTDWQIKIFDTIADNSSYGGLTLGPWDGDLARTDLRTVGMLISEGGQVVAEAVGAA